ncbi:oligosaccharide flippase family protein [Clostridium folliculivorans]|uniref:oligosaccharide flippase family protein n=1 Tax=Clostridium folliculivorans TaxID=2886038 RepID=UPI0021C44510|nr:oligosaccharide flippase family protein [Clostridium folliculivorans]GKU31669.1 hypothetical protein CFB3_37760 [Clostridium folliculivorans]
MNKKFKDFYYTLSANMLTFIMGVVTGFMIPAYLGYDDYNYIKVFGFYLTYVGIAHFGLLDGIYIKYGAYDYEDLPRGKFRSYFKFALIFQVLEAIVIAIGIFMFTKDSSRSIVMYFVVINMILMNMTSLFAFIHQFTKRFKLFSFNTVFTKLFYVIGCLILFKLNQYGYVYYIMIQTFVNLVVLLIYIYNNKEIVFGKSDSISKNVSEYKELFGTGFLVMMGNFITLVVLGIDRFIIDKFMTNYDFAMYSFAYTLVSLFFILLNSVTSVVYPFLTRAAESTYKNVYETSRYAISFMMTFTLSGYFIIRFVVEVFVNKYVDSLIILVFLVPTVVCSGTINILVQNMYKVLKATKDYTKNNLVALIIALLTNAIGFAIFRSSISVAVATLIAFILWVIYSDRYFSKILNINVKKCQMFDIIIFAVFIFTALNFQWYIGMIIYVMLLSLIIFIFFKKEFKNILMLIRK